MFTYDLALHPFTTRGTFLRFTPSDSGRLMLGSARSIPFLDMATKQWPHDFYEIALVHDGREVKYAWDAHPDCLTLTSENGRVTFAFDPPDTVVFDALGVGVRLIPGHTTATAIHLSDREWLFGDYRGRCVHQVFAGSGATLTVTQSPTASGDTGPFGDKGRTIEFGGPARFSGLLRFASHATTLPRTVPSLTTLKRTESRRWREWRERMPAVDECYRDAAEYSWHMLYSLEVPAEGHLTRPIALMSKRWMNKIWAWDNCFDALAMCIGDPERAFDQLRVYFDNQAPSGQFCDSLSTWHADYCFVKPPIYGWTITQLIQRLGKRRCMAFVKQAYEPVCRLTNWWYTQRDRDRNGMCEYYHGNDSGWDNSTMFDQGYPTDGSDLGAHLILQSEALAVMADMIGRRAEAASWRRKSQTQLKRLLRNVRGNRFISPRSGTSDAEPTQSLLNYIPMVLGDRLPATVRAAIVADLSPGGPFLTDYGLATEAPSSAKYDSHGYWRGPIWAPSTYLIFSGLVDAGETGLAQTIARRFCDLCVKTPGMWENYDARTGAGLCCPGYSWTAAVFVLMAEWLAKQPE